MTGMLKQRCKGVTHVQAFIFPQVIRHGPTFHPSAIPHNSLHKETSLFGSMGQFLSIVRSSVVCQCLTCREHDRARTTPGARTRASGSKIGTVNALDSSVLYVCHGRL